MSALPPELRAELLADLLSLERAEAAAARERMEAWVYRYLPELFSSAPGDFHRGIYADVEAMLWGRPIDGERRDAAAYAYPRGHGKTTTLCLGVAAWVIHEWQRMPHFKGRPPFIVIVSDALGNARDRLLDLRDQLEGNTKLREDYGDLTPAALEPGERARLKWTQTDFTTTTGVRVVALGSGSKVRGLLRKGRRPTLILCDDLENDEHVQTEEQRRKLRRWLTKALIPSGIEGDLLAVVMGTILHADSLLSRLLSPEHFDGWLKRRFAAQYTEDGQPSVDGTVPLWPAVWPIHLLAARRRKIGTLAYTQEYLNQPVDDASAWFKLAWLEACRNAGAGIGFLYDPPERIPFDVVISSWDAAELEAHLGPGAYQLLVTAWDLGLVDNERDAKSRDSDYSVGITVGLRADDRMEVRRIYRKRGLSPADLRARVIGEQEVVDADYVVVENNAAQRLHEIELREAPGLKGRVVGHTTDRRKHDVYEGVPGLALLLEQVRILFCWRERRERARIDQLIRELHGLGLEAHDDLVMALWMAVVVIRRWMRRRDAARRKLLGPPPTTWRPAYVAEED